MPNDFASTGNSQALLKPSYGGKMADNPVVSGIEKALKVRRQKAMSAEPKPAPSPDRRSEVMSEDAYSGLVKRTQDQSDAYRKALEKRKAAKKPKPEVYSGTE